MLTFKQFIAEISMSLHQEHPTTDEFESRLTKTTKVEPDEAETLDNYSKHSAALNSILFAYHHANIPVPSTFKLKHNNKDIDYNIYAMDAATNHRIGRNAILYSGIRYDPRHYIRSDGKMILPAYTSVSLSKAGANDFINPNWDKTENPEEFHMLKISAQPNDNAAVMGHIEYRLKKERELVLPRNTVLKIHRSVRDTENPNLWIHHATIEHDTDPNEFKGDINNIVNMRSNYHRALLGNDNIPSAIKQVLYKHYGNKFLEHIKSQKNLSDLVELSNYPHKTFFDTASQEFHHNENLDKLKMNMGLAHRYGILNDEHRKVLDNMFADHLLNGGKYKYKDKYNINDDNKSISFLASADHFGFLGKKSQKVLADKYKEYLENPDASNLELKYLSDSIKHKIFNDDIRKLSAKLLTDKIKNTDKYSDIYLGDAEKFGYLNDEHRRLLRSKLDEHINRLDPNEFSYDLHRIENESELGIQSKHELLNKFANKAIDLINAGHGENLIPRYRVHMFHSSGLADVLIDKLMHIAKQGKQNENQIKFMKNVNYEDYNDNYDSQERKDNIEYYHKRWNSLGDYKDILRNRLWHDVKTGHATPEQIQMAHNHGYYNPILDEPEYLSDYDDKYEQMMKKYNFT